MDTYKGEVIQFFGGINQYIGELDTTPHLNGFGWWRILNPCCPNIEQDGESARFSLIRIWGMDKLYLKFVDIYCPLDSLMEIRVLDKNGGFYKAYMKELERPDMNLIRPPGGE